MNWQAVDVSVATLSPCKLAGGGYAGTGVQPERELPRAYAIPDGVRRVPGHPARGGLQATPQPPHAGTTRGQGPQHPTQGKIVYLESLVLITILITAIMFSSSLDSMRR